VADRSVATLREACADRWMVGLAVSGLALRVSYALVSHLPSSYGDQADYVSIGRDFAAWWGSERAFRTPGYPAFLAAGFELGLGENALRVAQAVLLSAACYLLAVTARRTAGRLAGRATALIGAVYPPLLTVPSLLLSDALAAALVAAAVFATCEARYRRYSAGWLAAASTLTAAAALVRPNLILLLAVPAAIALLRPIRWRGAAVRLLALVLPVLILFGPWVARNYEQRGSADPLGTNHITIAQFPIDRSSGRYGAHERDVHATAQKAARARESARQAEPPDPWAQLLENLKERPLEQLSASVFWQQELWLFPFDDRLTYGAAPVVPYPLLLAAHLAFLVAAAVGLWMGRRQPAIRIVAAATATIAAPFLITASSPRLAIPAVAVLLIPAGTGVAAAAERVPRLRRLLADELRTA
jgi:4-amino-4-deoxy-L-arabinose transferase-like glycosyltransferase